MAANRVQRKGRKFRQRPDHGKELVKWTHEEARRNLEAWQESGLGMTEYCRRTGLSYHRLYWWKKQHGDWIIQNNPETAADNGIRWIQAEIGGLSPALEPEVSIHLRSGDRIEVYDSRRTDADWLQQISRGLLR